MRKDAFHRETLVKLEFVSRVWIGDLAKIYLLIQWYTNLDVYNHGMCKLTVQVGTKKDE